MALVDFSLDIPNTADERILFTWRARGIPSFCDLPDEGVFSLRPLPHRSGGKPGVGRLSGLVRFPQSLPPSTLSIYLLDV